MLIVSDYKDYYDTVQNMGVDKSCVYNRDIITYELDYDWRKKELSTNKIKNIPFTLPYPVTIGKIDYNFFIVGFCGNVYYGYTWIDPSTNEKKVSYDLESLYDMIPKKEKRYFYFSWRDFSPETLRKVEAQKYDDFFIELKKMHNQPIPIFVIENNGSGYRYSSKTKIVLNAKLKDYDFVTKRDVYTSFQDIYSYISGVLGISEKPTIEVSEKNKIQSKGFNEWSFRNPNPPKRKQ